MLKKVVVVAFMLALLVLSFILVKKTPQDSVQQEETQVVEVETQLPDMVFSFDKDSLQEKCATEDKRFCVVEKAVKCTINPEFADCAKTDLPKFIFMKDPGLERPTEMSYKIIDKKALNNDNVEIYTESNCNGGWFGLCQGTIIYVLAPKPENDWYVKDIYAVE